MEYPIEVSNSRQEEHEDLKNFCSLVEHKVKNSFGVRKTLNPWELEDELPDEVAVSFRYVPQDKSFIAINPRYNQISQSQLLWELREEYSRFCHSILNPELFNEPIDLLMPEGGRSDSESRMRKNLRFLEISTLQAGVARLGALNSGRKLPPDYGGGIEKLTKYAEAVTETPRRPLVTYLGIDIADRLYVPGDYRILRKSAHISSFDEWANIVERDSLGGSDLPMRIRALKRFFKVTGN